jgi:hypothetical protein
LACTGLINRGTTGIRARRNNYPHDEAGTAVLTKTSRMGNRPPTDSLSGGPDGTGSARECRDDAEEIYNAHDDAIHVPRASGRHDFAAGDRLRPDDGFCWNGTDHIVGWFPTMSKTCRLRIFSLFLIDAFSKLT